MIRYLCDTNVIREIMRRDPDPSVLHWFSGLQKIGLSVITVEEIQFGLRRKMLLEKESWFRRFLSGPVQIFEVTSSDGLWAGEKRGMLSSRGINLTQADVLIAAAASRNGLILATRNVRDFAALQVAVFNPFPKS